MTALWAAQLQAWGHEVTVITHTPDPARQPFPFPVLRRASAYRQWQAMRRADVVVQFDISLKGLPLWWLSGKPLVISHHTALHPPGTKLSGRQWMKALVCRHLPRLNICCSTFIAKGLGKAKTAVVNSPYDSNVFKSGDCPRRPHSVLFVGRLVSIKGADVFIDTVDLLYRAGYQELQATIVGAGNDLAALQQKTEALGLQSVVRFMGSLPPAQVAQLMQQHEWLLVPSWEEPFGTVVPEAQACGCKVIHSAAGGLMEAGGIGARQVSSNKPVDYSTLIIHDWQQPAQATAAENAEIAAHLQQLTVAQTATALMQNIHDAITR